MISQATIIKRGVKMDLYLLISFMLLISTSIMAYIYLRKLRGVYKEYGKAKGILEDIILSFNKDLERQGEEIRSVSQKTEEVLLEINKIRNSERTAGSEDFEKRIMEIKEKLSEVSKIRESLETRIGELDRKIEEVFRRQEEQDEKILRIESSLASSRVGVLETEPSGVEVKTAIPFRRERALARLTETELKVLEILASEGGKTASQIRERINLTREHTSRLMKSLYSRGYVERNTERLPYVYHIKKEMLELLRRQEEA